MQFDLLATPVVMKWTPPEPADIRGATFDLDRDGQRLTAQQMRVYNVVKSGDYYTLSQLSTITGDPEASVSARIRDLKRFGFDMRKEYVSRGLWRYRMVVQCR